MLLKWKKPLMATVDSCFTMTMECPLWQCTGSIDSITWSADTMTFIGCRCQTSRLMCADTPIVAIWQNREWIPRHYSILWGIRIYQSRWMCTRISALMMQRKNWNEWKTSKRRRRRLSRRRRKRCRRRCLR